jgi:hypothetical protein
MPDVTPNYGLRIPKADGTDLIIPDDIRIPVTSIDTILKTNSNGITSGDAALQAQIDALKTRLDAFDTTDPTLSTTPGTAITVSAGWTLSGETAYKFGKFAVLSFTFTRTGGTIAGQAEGNITNIGMGILKAGWAPIQRTGFMGGGVSGFMWAGYADPATSGSVLAVGAFPPNVGMTNGDTLVGTAMWVWK